MPQLAPLNWIILVMFFWSMTSYIVISFWWMKSKPYNIKQKLNKNTVNKKSWAW
uniref:ATP synthase complex subunit 8 n=1 Tax=Tonicia forbesii TaxID=1503220 RepID=A0A6H1PG09_9MOLL|nr:ATP synthase F0 subunit 8 [Tonicia forbesii]